ncbi:MAG: hypothetical protein WBE50_18120 [Methyloceanibacter sp.]
METTPLMLAASTFSATTPPYHVLDSALWHRPDEIGIRLVGDERGVRQIRERGAIAAIHHDLELEIAGRRCWAGRLSLAQRHQRHRARSQWSTWGVCWLSTCAWAAGTT